ncbi:unnamed protein product [marine sediment metagenome]|uniref:Uncharacterized protein n=1 Tax=marine sediment metagenome TaxID=412755 RepID=X1SDI9_9ZZZZ
MSKSIQVSSENLIELKLLKGFKKFTSIDKLVTDMIEVYKETEKIPDFSPDIRAVIAHT